MRRRWFVRVRRRRRKWSVEAKDAPSPAPNRASPRGIAAVDGCRRGRPRELIPRRRDHTYRAGRETAVESRRRTPDSKFDRLVKSQPTRSRFFFATLTNRTVSSTPTPRPRHATHIPQHAPDSLARPIRVRVPVRFLIRVRLRRRPVPRRRRASSNHPRVRRHRPPQFHLQRRPKD